MIQISIFIRYQACHSRFWSDSHALTNRVEFLSQCTLIFNDVLKGKGRRSTLYIARTHSSTHEDSLEFILVRHIICNIQIHIWMSITPQNPLPQDENETLTYERSTMHHCHNRKAGKDLWCSIVQPRVNIYSWYNWLLSRQNINYSARACAARGEAIGCLVCRHKNRQISRSRHLSDS